MKYFNPQGHLDKNATKILHSNKIYMNLFLSSMLQNVPHPDIEHKRISVDSTSQMYQLIHMFN